VKKRADLNLPRRRFLSRIPATAALCLGCSQGWVLAASDDQSQGSDDTHKFEREMPPMTHLRGAELRHRKYIGILKQLKKDIGEQKLLELLKKASHAENVALGQRLSSRIDTMETFAAPFRNADSGVGQTIVREIIEDTETVFEMRVTECLTERIFRELDALDLGYACVCHADFGLPEGMDIDITLQRSKTLMQGHDCCNHRYVWNT